MNKRILSGVQPSGQLHIGNYFGMIARMISLQSNSDLFCFVANYHSLTSINNKDEQIIIEISAKSFLHSQVRIMVGTLVDIAKGNINKTIEDIINSKNREVAGQTAPASGLYLKKIDY